MKPYLYLAPLLLILIVSCSTPKLAVPEQFTAQATKMPIKGLNGWMINQKLSFGDFKTTKIKRGWNISSTRQDRNTAVTTEERMLKVFNVNSVNSTTNQKNKYQYTIEDGNLVAEVFCLEKLTREELEVKTGSRILGDWSKTKNYQYSFSAAILPMTVVNDEPWQLVVYNNYDNRNDTARRLFDLPYVEEEGYASNGKETIDIKPLRVKNMVTKSGREAQFPVKMMTGYELSIEGAVIAVIDSMGHTLWVYNELDAPTRLVVAAITSALLLRQIKDEVNG